MITGLVLYNSKPGYKSQVDEKQKMNNPDWGSILWELNFYLCTA